MIRHSQHQACIIFCQRYIGLHLIISPLLINPHIIFLINQIGISLKNVIKGHHIPREQGDIFRYLVLSTQQPTSSFIGHLNYCGKKQRKSEQEQTRLALLLQK